MSEKSKGFEPKLSLQERIAKRWSIAKRWLGDSMAADSKKFQIF
jgi:hypothetical protein